jgi:hypothetical protein
LTEFKLKRQTENETIRQTYKLKHVSKDNNSKTNIKAIQIKPGDRQTEMKKTKNSNLNEQTKALIQKEKKDRQTNRNTTYRKRNMDQSKQAKFCAQKKWTDRQTDTLADEQMDK